MADIKYRKCDTLKEAYFLGCLGGEVFNLSELPPQQILLEYRDWKPDLDIYVLFNFYYVYSEINLYRFQERYG